MLLIPESAETATYATRAHGNTHNLSTENREELTTQKESTLTITQKHGKTRKQNLPKLREFNAKSRKPGQKYAQSRKNTQNHAIPRVSPKLKIHAKHAH